MKVYEFLSLFRSIFIVMARNGISQNDIVFLDMYHEYIRMLQEGQKEAEIWTFLSQKYKLSASTIKKAVKRLNQEYELWK